MLSLRVSGTHGFGVKMLHKCGLLAEGMKTISVSKFVLGYFTHH